MQLPCDDVGNGPAVVLLHAGVADRRMWAEHLDPIASAGYRVIAPDLPGFGQAPASVHEAPWSDVLDTMDALGVTTATLVGNSFGGAVALSIAVLAPARVRALLLVSAPPPDLEPSPELQAAWDAESAALERGELEAAVDAVIDAWTLDDAPPAQRELVATMQRRAFELQLAIEEPEMAEDPLEANPGALSTLATPALVAAGELDMPDFRGGAEAMSKELPNARHHVIAGAGHLAPLERPAEFRELLFMLLGGA